MKTEGKMARFDATGTPILRDTLFRRVAMTLVMAIMAIVLNSCATPPPPRAAVDVEPEKQQAYKSGSLWPGANKKNILFSDNKASKVGDIVTVHVIESTTALNKADTTDQTTNENSLILDTGAVTPTQMKLGGGRKTVGKGSTGRSDQFSSTVSCLVTEVLPNGNMTVEGQRRMLINNEEQYILVRGTVRPSDITFSNSVLSSKVADLDIKYSGGGGIDGGRSPGWLSKALNKIWPF
jgi:flagellar L-ring protein precursor FlgH